MKIVHDERKRTINMGCLFLLGLGYPTVLDFDDVFKHNIDWDDVRFQEMFNLNDIEGFSHERRMLCVDDFLSELQDNELLFLKLNEIAAEALIAVINHHPLFEVTAKEVKPTDRRQAVYLQHEVRRIFQEQVSKEPVNNHLHSV